MLSSRYITLIVGTLSGLIFAPFFLSPFALTLAILCYQVKQSTTFRQAAIYGFIFGFGHFLIGLYWISFGVAVYIEDFWWAIPFALFGLPLVLACFVSAGCYISWYMRNCKQYQMIFCICWVFFEWLRSWIFTGLPWNLLGYTLSFSETLTQISSIISIYGLSFLVIYISTIFYHKLIKDNISFITDLLSSIILLIVVVMYGQLRLNNNPTKFSNIKIRLVQPSIPQSSKWDANQFWRNLDSHIKLSYTIDKPDLIIWSESALVVPHTYQPVKHELLKLLNNSDSILLTGGVTENNDDDNPQIYTALYALNSSGDVLFEYHKSHLVPFGEYMPLKNILPIKKLTHGFVDYSEGKSEIVNLEKFKLKIKSLICYEAIFPSEVRTSNQMADIFINVTNDSWYGDSSGPYQHFHISRMRAVENGIPMLRVGNNGISAIIDPLGRVIKKLDLNQVGTIDGLIPEKLASPTLYSVFGDLIILSVVLLVLLNQQIMSYLVKHYSSFV